MSGKNKVLYFTMVPLTYPSGGGICCFNHVRKLSEQPNLDLSVVTMGSSKFESGERKKLSGLNLRHWYLQTEGSEKKLSRWPGFLQIEQEKYALRSSRINTQLEELLSKDEFDTIIIDYLFSLLFAPSLLLHSAQKLLVSLNREAEFMNDQIEKSNGFEYIFNRIKQWRIARFERKVFNSMDKAVFLSNRDIPKYEIKAKPYVVTPEIEDKQVSWSFSGSQKILFVGSIDHPPNQKGVDWLCDQLAPALHKSSQAARLTIVSRVQDKTRKSLPSNVEWHSDVDDSQLENLMTTSDLFISPIENDFGVKFKLLDCLSYRTPFLATEGCLCGLPFLGEQPPLDLNNPKEAAQRIVNYLNNGDLLNSLSVEQHEKERSFKHSNKNIWYDVITDGTDKIVKLNSLESNKNRHQSFISN